MSDHLLTPTGMPAQEAGKSGEKPRVQDQSETVMRAESSLGRALRSYAVLSILLSLTIRVLHRGPYYPGLDVEGAAGGLFRVATLRTSELWRFHWANDHSSTSVWSFNEMLFTLGHDAFMKRVFVFGSQEHRLIKLPIRPVHNVHRFVNRIKNPVTLHGFWIESPLDPPIVREEATTVITALERRFVLDVGPPVKDLVGAGTLKRFVVQPR